MLPDEKWLQIEAYMRESAVEQLAIRIFGTHYRLLAAGHVHTIAEQEIEPVESLADLEDLPTELERAGQRALSQTVMLKLNGGLGTSMGLEGPKSLLPLREGYSFLDLIVKQATSLQVPLLLMNSFATDSATREMLSGYDAADSQRIETFLQHRVPKLRVDDLTAIEWPANPELTWCPPGHGDLYAAIQTSDMLDRLLSEGYRWLFVSNADNLGATLDLRVLGYLAEHENSFLMEVADRTLSDRKGGHLARRADGTLLLRESAQCHDRDQAAFQDVEKHGYFNTNNLWVDLHALATELQRHEQMMPLSLIVNQKRVDPTDSNSPAVYQLETAMGSAIASMPHSTALRVPRWRFAPVKTTGDLLTIRSDAYRLDQQYAVRLVDERNGIPPVVKLDDGYYKTIGQLDRLIGECPSLRECASLTINGPFELNTSIRFHGNVELINHGSESVTLNAGDYTGRHEYGTP